MPSRNDTVTATCQVCATALPEGRARITCSDACRQALWRRRHQPDLTPPPLPAARPRRPVTVYECPNCDVRQLGDQYCQNCATFMRRLGTGGLCPCCDEPITHNELLAP